MSKISEPIRQANLCNIYILFKNKEKRGSIVKIDGLNINDDSDVNQEKQ
jgi:hypothetical protein